MGVYVAGTKGHLGFLSYFLYQDRQCLELDSGIWGDLTNFPCVHLGQGSSELKKVKGHQKHSPPWGCEKWATCC